MDRIYTTEDHDTELFKNYARKMGWVYKRSNNSEKETDLVWSDGKISTDVSMRIALNNIAGKGEIF